MYKYMYICMYMYIYFDIYTYMYIYMYICIYIYTYICKHTHAFLVCLSKTRACTYLNAHARINIYIDVYMPQDKSGYYKVVLGFKSTLQRTTTHCNTLRRAAIHCKKTRINTYRGRRASRYTQMLQRNIVCCSVLQSRLGALR